MPISDGYGDDVDLDNYIRENERLIRLKAADRLRGNQDARQIWDDVLNEARIVQWEVLRKRPDAPRAYVSAAMSHRIGEVVTRGTWTGMSRTHGKPKDPLRRHDRSSLDAPANGSDETPDVGELVVSSPDWMDRILISYHRGEIMRALAELTFTQRAYVVRRFWGGWTNPEIAEERGISTKEVERQWRVNIRPALAERLRHLASD